MVKCPNCGSTAQMKFMFADHPTFSHTIERWMCACGCSVERKLKEEDRIITYPNGGVQYTKTLK